MKKFTPKYIQQLKFLSRFNFTIKYRPNSINVRLNVLNKKLKYVLKDVENNKFRVREKLFIDLNYFDLESFSNDRLFNINSKSFTINAIIEEGAPLVIYTLENNLKDREENNESLNIYINDLIN